MRVDKFLLDVSNDGNSSASQNEERFFFRDSESFLNAWIIHQDQKGCTIIKAFRASTSGSMVLQDLLKVEFTIKIIGHDSNGFLLAEAGQGLLRFNCQEGNIIGRAELGNNGIAQKVNSQDSIPTHLIAGMKESDCIRCNDLILSRQETFARDFNQEPFFLESLLLISTEHLPRIAGDCHASVAIGNSQVDNNLNLISCMRQQPFKIPILNFTLDYRNANPTVLLIGWNRFSMQVISINRNQASRDLFSDQLDHLSDYEELIKLEECLLVDESKPFVNNAGRIAVWKDMLNPGTFYTWNRDD